jgi:hypothetical protein
MTGAQGCALRGVMDLVLRERFGLAGGAAEAWLPFWLEFAGV